MKKLDAQVEERADFDFIEHVYKRYSCKKILDKIETKQA